MINLMEDNNQNSPEAVSNWTVAHPWISGSNGTNTTNGFIDDVYGDLRYGITTSIFLMLVRIPPEIFFYSIAK